MSWIAPRLVGRIPVAALANPPALVELFAETIVEELDFRLEADNMMDIAGILAETDQRSLVVPRPTRAGDRRVLVMERLDGFSWDDVEGMHRAGIDTSAVVKAGMIAFLEGAMLFGVFHGDLHGGNLFVRADGRVALLDFGITGRLDEGKRLAFLRLLMGGTVNDVTVQMEALRDLGALPADTDLHAVMADLGLDKPTKDPTQMDPEELVAEIRDLTKALLGYGARLPKELMLFIKDLLFLDGALATLAPDVDLFQEITDVASYFATRYGERIARRSGSIPGSRRWISKASKHPSASPPTCRPSPIGIFSSAGRPSGDAWRNTSGAAAETGPRAVGRFGGAGAVRASRRIPWTPPAGTRWRFVRFCTIAVADDERCHNGRPTDGQRFPAPPRRGRLSLDLSLIVTHCGERRETVFPGVSCAIGHARRSTSMVRRTNHTCRGWSAPL